MTTDDMMILNFVGKHGFTLPEGLTFADGHWTLSGRSTGSIEPTPRQVYDLCAAEFARQVKNRPIGGTNRASLEKFMGFGNSPDAIKALWEALQ